MTTALFVAGLCSKNRFYFKVMSSFILFINKERGIRTLDTLPYTHFPGVRLRPLKQKLLKFLKKFTTLLVLRIGHLST
jgi:hypothetical protein